MVILRLVWMFLVGLMVLGAGVVFSQNYPNKPIRIVASGAGGGSDFMVRLIALELTGSLRQVYAPLVRLVPVQLVSPKSGGSLSADGRPLKEHLDWDK